MAIDLKQTPSTTKPAPLADPVARPTVVKPMAGSMNGSISSMAEGSIPHYISQLQKAASSITLGWAIDAPMEACIQRLHERIVNGDVRKLESTRRPIS
mgnify:CR=1 FL=1